MRHEMETSTVTSKGQLVVPATIRRKYGIKRGTKIAFIEENGKIYLQPLNRDYLQKVSGSLESQGKVSQVLSLGR
jgi:AbrB family looped-hinge helix DNA binding protein